MNVVRLYTGSDERSHFEDVPIQRVTQQLGDFLPSMGTRAIFFYCAAVGRVNKWHRAPRRQCVIPLSGSIEVEIGTGERRQIEPGAILFAEDVTGEGHVTRTVGDEPCYMAWIALAEGS